MGVRYGQGPWNERRQKPILSFWRKTLTSGLEDNQAVAQGLAGSGEGSGQDAPAVCFLPSRLLPKANKVGWENEGDLEEREMPSQVAQPRNLRRELQLELCSLPVTLCGQNPRLANDPKPRLLGMEKHFTQPQETRAKG